MHFLYFGEIENLFTFEYIAHPVKKHRSEDQGKVSVHRSLNKSHRISHINQKTKNELFFFPTPN